MAVLKNKTQKNFTMISNNILRDKSLSMKDCGVLCTLCSLPDGWEFSIVGLSATVPDGVDSIRKSITNLEELGYMNRTKSRGSDGKGFAGRRKDQMECKWSLKIIFFSCLYSRFTCKFREISYSHKIKLE